MVQKAKRTSISSRIGKPDSARFSLKQISDKGGTVEDKKLEFKIGPKGGVSVYGLWRFPVTLYYGQWIRLLDAAMELREFLEANKHSMKLKP